MCLLSQLVQELGQHLSGTSQNIGGIIRRHTKKLKDLGDLSFPLNPKSWSRVLNCDSDLEENAAALINQQWILPIDKFSIKNNDMHLFLKRPEAFKQCFQLVLVLGSEYGFHEKLFHKAIVIKDDLNGTQTDPDLTQLRTLILRQVLTTLVHKLTSSQSKDECIDIKIVMDRSQTNCIMCGPVQNETGTKNKTSVAELHSSRAVELRMIAQHRYGIKLSSKYNKDYFNKLGREALRMEMLQNKPQKPIKLCLNSADSRNREPSFIFYNSARLSVLLKEFDFRVVKKHYDPLPGIDDIQFTLLNQPEEWEILFVYILQLPDLIKSCVCDIEKGVVNPHNLVVFLANLSSIFSVYYRRVKILTIGFKHLLPVLYARIYLLKCVQQVFYSVFDILGIDPVEEM